jgi:hypothetical protein
LKLVLLHIVKNASISLLSHIPPAIKENARYLSSILPVSFCHVMCQPCSDSVDVRTLWGRTYEREPCPNEPKHTISKAAAREKVLRGFWMDSTQWACGVMLKAPSIKIVHREDLFMRGSPSKEFDFRLSLGFPYWFVLEVGLGALELHFVCRCR